MRERTVLITGAASGIGRALAYRFAAAGARLGLLDRDRAGLDQLSRELAAGGTAVRTAVCDVASFESCCQAVPAVAGDGGGVDVLVNNAGITHLSRFAATDVEVFHRVMDVNFFGALHCTKAALPGLVARRGLIVVMSSVAGFAPLGGRSGYAASKHALHGLFESLRAELRQSGVGVLMVCPSFTRTNIGRNALGADGRPAGDAIRTTTGKEMEPAAVAEAIFGAARRRRRLLVLSPVGKMAFLVSRLLPSIYERLMARQLMREETQPE